jgi:hypothetical protein
LYGDIEGTNRIIGSAKADAVSAQAALLEK